MNKKDKRSKTKKAETKASNMYDCCWYGSSCYDLCCGNVCCRQALQMISRNWQSSKGYGSYFFGMKPNAFLIFFNENVNEKEGG